jgi:hypothetical protein
MTRIVVKRKKVKIEKETRRVLEGIAELIKKKGETYKFKTKKKKEVKRIKRTCVHWTRFKGKYIPTLFNPGDNQNIWECRICGHRFPVVPDAEKGEKAAWDFLGIVDQAQFLAVGHGGNSDDTKLFMQLKQGIPRFIKAQKSLIKFVTKRKRFEDRFQDEGINPLEMYGFKYN